jgi:hypothetical protein
VVDGGLGEAGQHVVISHNLVCHAPDDELALCNGKPGNVLVSKKADRRRRGPELGGGAVALSVIDIGLSLVFSAGSPIEASNNKPLQ